MKKLLTLLILPFLMACSAAAPAPIPQAEQTHAQHSLWFNQKLFGIETAWIDIKIVHMSDMSVQGAWGVTHFNESGAHIEVVATEDMPADFPQDYRKKFQNDVIQHEAMHVKLTIMGVPGEAQDGLIGGLLASLQKVK